MQAHEGENFQMQNQHELAVVSSLTVNSGTAPVETEVFGVFGVYVGTGLG